MKTIKEWIEELPEPYRSQALKYEDFCWESVKGSMSRALTGAFIWAETEEGYDYWKKLLDNYEEEI